MSRVPAKLFFDVPYCIMPGISIYYIKIESEEEGIDMPGTRDTAAQRLREWLRGLEAFDLPDWDELPQLDLYMDQVILLLKRYLAPLGRSGEEKAITASIINNYVRMKVMPPPVKKKYSRAHIAYLVIICALKQSLSISQIQQLLPEDREEGAVRALYTEFVGRFRDAAAFVCRSPRAPERSALEDGGGLAMTAAILSVLSKSLTDFLLYEEDGEED